MWWSCNFWSMHWFVFVILHQCFAGKLINDYLDLIWCDVDLLPLKLVSVWYETSKRAFPNFLCVHVFKYMFVRFFPFLHGLIYQLWWQWSGVILGERFSTRLTHIYWPLTLTKYSGYAQILHYASLLSDPNIHLYLTDCV